MSSDGYGKYKHKKQRNDLKPYSTEKNLLTRVKDRVKNIFTSSIWGESLLKPSFLGILSPSTEAKESLTIEKPIKDNVACDVNNEISLPIKSTNILSLSSIPPPPITCITTTPIFPREGVPLLNRKINHTPIQDSLRQVENNILVDRQPSFSISKPEFSSTLYSDNVSKPHNIITKSPFYPGKTTFGGSSTVGKSYLSSPYSKTPIKRRLQAKPFDNTSSVNTKSLVTSSTAKRILETLENMSSPVTTAKKIPSFNDYSKEFTPAAYHRRTRMRFSLDGAPPVTSMNNSRLNTTTDAIFLPNISLKQNNNEKNNSTQHTGKIRTRINESQHYSSKQTPDVPNDLNYDLDNVSRVKLDVPNVLQFDFNAANFGIEKNANIDKNKNMLFISKNVSPLKNNTFESLFKKVPVSSTYSITSLKPSMINGNEKPLEDSDCTKSSIEEFNIALGVKSSNGLQYEINDSLDGNINDFTFSKGISPIEASFSSSRQSTKRKANDNNDLTDIQPPKEKFHIQTTNTNELPLTSSIKKKEGAWICNHCFVNNEKSANICICCSAENENNKQKNVSALPSLSSIFTSKPGSWSCKDCFVKNNPDKMKCVSCSASKPSKKRNSGDNNSQSETKLNAPLNELKDLCKKDISKWNCPTCLISNNDNCLKCVCCEEAKPGNSNTTSSFKNENKSLPNNTFSSSINDSPCFKNISVANDFKPISIGGNVKNVSINFNNSEMKLSKPSIPCGFKLDVPTGNQTVLKENKIEISNDNTKQLPLFQNKDNGNTSISDNKSITTQITTIVKPIIATTNDSNVQQENTNPLNTNVAKPASFEINPIQPVALNTSTSINFGNSTFGINELKKDKSDIFQFGVAKKTEAIKVNENSSQSTSNSNVFGSMPSTISSVPSTITFGSLGNKNTEIPSFNAFSSATKVNIMSPSITTFGSAVTTNNIASTFSSATKMSSTIPSINTFGSMTNINSSVNNFSTLKSNDSSNSFGMLKSTSNTTNSPATTNVLTNNSFGSSASITSSIGDITKTFQHKKLPETGESNKIVMEKPLFSFGNPVPQTTKALSLPTTTTLFGNTSNIFISKNSDTNASTFTFNSSTTPKFNFGMPSNNNNQINGTANMSIPTSKPFTFGQNSSFTTGQSTPTFNNPNSFGMQQNVQENQSSNAGFNFSTVQQTPNFNFGIPNQENAGNNSFQFSATPDLNSTQNSISSARRPIKRASRKLRK